MWKWRKGGARRCVVRVGIVDIVRVGGQKLKEKKKEAEEERGSNSVVVLLHR